MIKRLLNQYSESPLLKNLIIKFFDEPTEEIESVAQDLGQRLFLDDIDGVQLDKIGIIVGQNRPLNFSDAEYRILLRARIFLNVSGATIAEIERYSQLVLGAPAQLFNGFTFVDLTFFRPISPMEQTIIAETLTAAAGIRIRFLGFAGGENPFGFVGNINNTGYTTYTPENTSFLGRVILKKPDLESRQKTLRIPFEGLHIERSCGSIKFFNQEAIEIVAANAFVGNYAQWELSSDDYSELEEYTLTIKINGIDYSQSFAVGTIEDNLDNLMSQINAVASLDASYFFEDDNYYIDVVSENLASFEANFDVDVELVDFDLKLLKKGVNTLFKANSSLPICPDDELNIVFIQENGDQNLDISAFALEMSTYTPEAPSTEIGDGYIDLFL